MKKYGIVTGLCLSFLLTGSAIFAGIEGKKAGEAINAVQQARVFEAYQRADADVFRAQAAREEALRAVFAFCGPDRVPGMKDGHGECLPKQPEAKKK
jgi:hypothetical protein